MRTLLNGLSLGLAIAAGAASAAPATLIYINSSTGALYSYDSANAYAETLISASAGAFSISSGPAANTLYIANGGLSTYNLTTNAVTAIGGSVPGNALGEGRDGLLYAGSGSQLYSVNPLTGASTLIGAGTWGYAGDIAVDPTSLLDMYGAVSNSSGVALVKVNKATGAQTLIGDFGVSGSIFGLGFSLDGTLYATGPDASGGSGLYTINKTTGAATLVHSLSYAAYDMATQPFETTEPNVVPEPATLGLVGLALLGVAGARRRRG